MELVTTQKLQILAAYIHALQACNQWSYLHFFVSSGTMASSSETWGNWGSPFIIRIWHNSWYLEDLSSNNIVSLFNLFISRFPTCPTWFLLPCCSFDWVWCRRHWREWLCWMHQRAHSFGNLTLITSECIPCPFLIQVIYNFSTLQGWQCRLTDEQFIAVKELVRFISYCVASRTFCML